MRYGSRTRSGTDGYVKNWGRRSASSALIRSVQRGTISLVGATSNTATITSVDADYAIVRYLGQSVSSGSAWSTDVPSTEFAKVVLTNATTVTATMNTAGSTIIVAYEVVEYWPSALNQVVQRGTITITSGNLTNTATITSVDTTKAVIEYGGFSTDTSGANATSNTYPRLDLTNATTVTATRGGSAAGNPVIVYQVVEFDA